VTDTTLQRIADELEIRDMVARVAHLTDTAEELDEYMALYTEDATWGPQPGAFDSTTGHAAIEAGVRERRAAGIQGPGTNTQHVVNTTSVRFDGPDTAKVRAYWQYYGDVATAPKLLRVGTYDLVVVRTADGWKFHERRIGSTAS
jgi:uncharacterized protein (TIGR02246 family)